MKFKLLSSVLITSILFSCVSQSDYDKLKIEKENSEKKFKSENREKDKKIEKVKYELSLLKEDLNQLMAEKRLSEIEKNRKPYVSELEAKKYLKDYYDFYESDNIYRNAKFRRVDDNVFKVSLEECTKKGGFSDNDFYWHSIVKTLNVKNDGTYSLSLM
jgi:hypothetical protein